MNQQTSATVEDVRTPVKGLVMSTAQVQQRDRHEWLEEMIKQEYTKVRVRPDEHLFNETTFYDWSQLRLSVIQSHKIGIQRFVHEPYSISQDNYLAVMLLSGSYCVEQGGQEAWLRPGDMAIYDATQPHKIDCPANFSKLLVAIPRSVLRDRINGVERCTALPISGKSGVGNLTSSFMHSLTSQLDTLDKQAFDMLSEHFLDLLTMSLGTVRPQNIQLAKSKSATLHVIKKYIESHLDDPNLNSMQIAAAVGYSPRYINTLFNGEDTSLMRYVWSRRLDNCKLDMLSQLHAGSSVSEFAFRWGFNDFSHFSRVFKRKFGMTPKDMLNNFKC